MAKRASTRHRASQGRSDAGDARNSRLEAADEERPRLNLAQVIRSRIDPVGGVDLDIPEREPPPDPLRFD